MKNRFFSFIAGALATLMLVALPISALASDGALTIKRIRSMSLSMDRSLNQRTQRETDVLVFTVGGTTYAPLRALAEAYDLEVGYDAKSHTATVTNPAKVSGTPTVANDFASSWTVKEKPVTNYGNEKIFTAKYSGSLSESEFKSWWKSLSADEIEQEANKMAAEAQSMNPGYTVTMYFSFGQHNLGTAYAYGDNEFSNFTVASVWIK